MVNKAQAGEVLLIKDYESTDQVCVACSESLKDSVAYPAKYPRHEC